MRSRDEIAADLAEWRRASSSPTAFFTVDVVAVRNRLCADAGELLAAVERLQASSDGLIQSLRDHRCQT